MKIKNAVCYSFSLSGEDPMAHLRLIAPFRQAGINIINGIENNQIIIDRVLEGDFVIIQRDFPREFNTYKKIIEFAHKEGKPVVFDLDDLLFCLPENHPDRQSAVFGPSLLPMFQLLMEADLVSVATPKLRDFVINYNDNVAVLPNYFDDNLWHLKSPVLNTSEHETLTIGYMGGNSHRPDLEYITPVLLDLIKRYPQKLRFQFWGVQPPVEVASLTQVQWSPTTTYRYKDFAAFFQAQTADIFIAPLIDNLFNRCKSPIKFFEYSALGVPGVFSRLETYADVVTHGQNGLLATSLDEWTDCLIQLIEDKELRFYLAKNAQETIKSNWLLSRNAFRWKETFQSAFDIISSKQNSHTVSIVESINFQLFETFDKKEAAVQTLTAQVAEKEQAVAALTAQVAEKEQTVAALTAQVAEKEQAVAALTAQVAEKEQTVAALTAQVAEKEQAVAALSAQVAEIYHSKAWRVVMLLRRVRQFLIPRGSWRAKLFKKLFAIFLFPFSLRRNFRIQQDLTLIRASGLFDEAWYIEHNPDVAQSRMDPARHYLLFGGFEGRDPGPNFSSKWYLNTYSDVLAAKVNPLVHYLRFGQQEGRFLPKIETQTFNSHGGIILALSKAWKVFRREGIRGVFSRLHYMLRWGNSSSKGILSSVAGGESKTVDAEYLRIRAFHVVPYYLDPYAIAEIGKIPSTLKIAVHLHLFYLDMLDQCVKYLNNVPVRFDLYVSITEENDQDEIAKFLQSHINLLNKVIVKKVPNRGRDLAPLIIDFGKDLQNYDFVAHIHTKKSPHAPHLDDWFEKIMGTLFGSPSNIYQIFKLLLNDAKFVYPAPNEKILIIDESGWGDNYILAQNLFPKLLEEKIESYPLIEFPQGSMFWAKSNAISKFISFPLEYTDFPLEPLSPDGTFLHALERLLLISANKIPGRNYCIYSSDSTIKEPYYESQNDYSNSLAHKTVKVLSYYLPQFYAIPENDEWHGKGFTEWNKVRSANPLFYGHFQQRIPHKDLGYYLLNSPEMLKKHAELMKRSGVYGQIFYHYWFSGKLILEKPSQMLLADKSIEMPFCFCWANENWTRKWDGNEDEILLGQKYSEQDAIQFINYLIPFFKDERYIKIAGRPVLYIYRPSSIPDFELYKTIWQKICAENGIKAPFIVAVLTRGAQSPEDFGMDAGCERVLHDWTDGNVKDIKNSLDPYWPINGSVLSYDEVADYYMSQPPKTDFTYFRSIIASWDNTPRYGLEAYIVHNSTPEKFQEWLEALIVDAGERLPENQRFVIVNAWNEWAESALIEPDSRFGYAYLNSIGRALSGIKFQDREYLRQTISKTTQVAISISDYLLNQFQHDEIQRQKMLSCIVNSTVISLCNVVFEQSQVVQWMSSFSGAFASLKEKNAKSDYALFIKDICYIAPDAIENMLKMALRYDVGVVTPTHLNDEKFTHQHLLKRWETKQISPFMFLIKNDDKRSMKCCVDAGIFISQSHSSQRILDQKVSTIIRFSQSGSLKLLQNALYSLIAQVGCTVQPIIAVQDLTDDITVNLETMLKKMPWDDNCYPIIKKYYSTEKNRDLRSLMLNDSLKTVETKYAAFLDYDDIMFHDAYAWFIERLRKTEKNASFGLIYSTVFHLAEKKIITRKVVYDYGKDYEHFLNLNHTPINGFMLNMSKINLEHIEFYEDMKYMEDYFLTLQIFTEADTDWESLKQRKFVADYYHFEDRLQTLAFYDDDKRKLLLSNPEYLSCEARIVALRQKILGKNL